MDSVNIWVMQIISRLNGQWLAIFPATDPSLQGKVSLGSVCPLNRSGLARDRPFSAPAVSIQIELFVARGDVVFFVGIEVKFGVEVMHSVPTGSLIAIQLHRIRSGV